METTTTLSSIITGDMITGVFDQLLSMLPVVVPAVLGLLGIRKAFGFVMAQVKKA